MYHTIALAMEQNRLASLIPQWDLLSQDRFQTDPLAVLLLDNRLYIYERTNVPVFSDCTQTLFQQPQQICSARLPALLNPDTKQVLVIFMAHSEAPSTLLSTLRTSLAFLCPVRLISTSVLINTLAQSSNRQG